MGMLMRRHLKNKALSFAHSEEAEFETLVEPEVEAKPEVEVPQEEEKKFKKSK